MSAQTNCFSLIIFDLDGTLIDAFEDITAAANFIRSRNSLPALSLDQVKDHVGHGARYLVEGVLDTKDTATVDENLKALVGYYEGLTESKASIYDGVADTLDTLHQHSIRTAIASNKPDSVTQKVVKSLGLADKFDFIRGETPDIRRKPAPDVLHRIMQDAGVPPQRTLMVGDSEVDIQTAHAAGIKVAAVTYGQHTAERLAAAHPDFIIHKMPELLNIIGA